MIFIQLDEVLIDRVGHAAGVFGFEVPCGVGFSMSQLVASLGFNRAEFNVLLDAAQPDWSEAELQPWALGMLRQMDVAGLDYRLLGTATLPHDPYKHLIWVERRLGLASLDRLVTVSSNLTPPMHKGDLLVDVSERNGAQWKKRNGRFIQWRPYTSKHPEFGQQWLSVLGQM